MRLQIEEKKLYEMMKQVVLEVMDDKLEKLKLELISYIQQDKATTIKPAPRLKPLPTLEGFVPEGWKDTIYE